MKKSILSGILAILSIVLLPSAAFAHVVVMPKEAGIAERLIFNVGVPNEKAVAMDNLKLIIPSGVTDVMPTSKGNWSITTTKASDGEVTSITWSGSLPVGEREDFSFSAQVPARPTELDWKAYQTYADTTTVHWDQKPTGDDESADAGPYSITAVTDDLSDASNAQKDAENTPEIWGAYAVASVAFIVAIGAFIKKREEANHRI